MGREKGTTFENALAWIVAIVVFMGINVAGFLLLDWIHDTFLH